MGLVLLCTFAVFGLWARFCGFGLWAIFCDGGWLLWSVCRRVLLRFPPYRAFAKLPSRPVAYARCSELPRSCRLALSRVRLPSRVRCNLGEQCAANRPSALSARRFSFEKTPLRCTKPRGIAAGLCKKILESKKRLRLGPLSFFGKWQEGRSGPSLPQWRLPAAAYGFPRP